MSVGVPNSKEPGSVAWQLIEPHWRAISIYDGPLAFLRDFEKLPKSVQHLLPVWWCDSEVCNGGFHQFFWNDTGVLAPEAAEGFRAVGLVECAELVEAAISKFGEPYPRDRTNRCEHLLRLKQPGKDRKQWDPFDSIDDRYYAAKNQPGFYERFDEYATRRRDSHESGRAEP